MKFFITGELGKKVFEKTRKIIIDIQKNVDTKLANKNFGDGIKNWGFVAIINTEDTYDAGFFRERTLYSHKNKETDFRLKINYEDMLKANDKEAHQLVCRSIIRSIDIAESKKIKDFDFESFRKDITDLFMEKGWI